MRLSVCLGLAALVAGTSHAVATTLAPGDSLSIAECVALARRAAPDVRAATSDRAAARADSAAAAFNRRPAFSLFGGAIVAPDGFYDPALTNLGEYGLRAGLAVPLLDGGARGRERAQGGLAARAALLDLTRAARDAGLRAAALAVDLLRQREDAAAGLDSFEWLDRLAGLVESGVRSGARARSDADRVTLERDAVGAQLATVRQVDATLRRELAELVGGPGEGGPEVREPTDFTDAPLTPADSLALLDGAGRAPEVLAAQVRAAEERLALDEARRRNALHVDVAADAGIWGSDLTRAVPPDLALSDPDATFAERLRRDLGASVALQFRRPVLDPARGAAVEARTAALAAAEARAATAATQRRRLVLDLFGQWRAAAERLTLAESSLARAQANLLRMRSLYAGGGSSMLELLDARRQFDDALLRRADARFDARLARWACELQR